MPADRASTSRRVRANHAHDAEEGTRQGGAQAVERALRVLGAFVDAREATSLGVTELASILGLSLPTAHRLLRVLVDFGYLAQDGSTSRYRLGRSALLLGHAASREFGLDRAREVIDALADATGESVNLGVRDGERTAVVLLRAESRFELRLAQPVGTRVLLHSSAMGKSILAFAGEKPLVPPTPLERFTEHTITKPRALLAELDRTRERGYSIDDEEGLLGVRCVGAPVLQDGVLRAAVTIQVPTVRMPPERFSELGVQVIEAARRLAQVLPADRSPN